MSTPVGNIRAADKCGKAISAKLAMSRQQLEHHTAVIGWEVKAASTGMSTALFAEAIAPQLGEEAAKKSDTNFSNNSGSVQLVGNRAALGTVLFNNISSDCCCYLCHSLCTHDCKGC